MAPVGTGEGGGGRGVLGAGGRVPALVAVRTSVSADIALRNHPHFICCKDVGNLRTESAELNAG